MFKKEVDTWRTLRVGPTQLDVGVYQSNCPRFLRVCDVPNDLIDSRVRPESKGVEVPSQFEISASSRKFPGVQSR